MPIPMDKEDRARLDMLIDRAVFEYVDQIKEHAQDFTMIYLNKTHNDVDRAIVKGILDIVKTAIEDGKLAKMDLLKKKLDKITDEWTGNQSPTVFPQQNVSPAHSQVSQPPKKGKKTHQAPRKSA